MPEITEKKTVDVANMSVEAFRGLPAAEKRTAQVNWDQIIANLTGKIFTIKDVEAQVKQYKEKFNYSEWYRVVEKLNKEAKHKVEERKGEDGTRLYALDLPQ